VLGAAIVAVVQVVPSTAIRASTQVGYQGNSYAGFGAEDAGGQITGQKPESKLWFHDGVWWAAMLSPTALGSHTIHRLDGTTWVDTGVPIDQRPATKEDVLSAGSTLYVLSRAPKYQGPNRLRRYSYTGGAYHLDPGFPVDVPGAGAETTTIARDGTGTLWLTYEASGRIYVARSSGSDTVWGTPLVIPGSSAVDGDDISAVVSFTDATGPAIGVMWSDQVADRQFFGVHRDGTADSSWTIETAATGVNEADDHINMKVAEGRVYAVVKTSKSSSLDTLIQLLVRSPEGTWTKYPVSRVAEGNTRPITILQIDPVARDVLVFMTIGEGTAARGIAYKRASLDSIAFPSQAVVFIRGPNDEVINNATSTKQNLTAASGIVIVASDGTRYWWNREGGTPGSVNGAPTATDVSASLSAGTPVALTLEGTDVESCELAFSITSGPANGTLGTVGDQPCTAGTPNRDRVSVTYTPAPGYAGADAFTFTVNDGTVSSSPATVTLTISATTGIAFRGASSAANTGTATLSIDRPSATLPGDVMVATIDVRGAPTVTAPLGWTLVRTDVDGNVMKKATYVRVAGSAEPVAYTWTFSKAQAASGGILAFSGVDPASPVDAVGGQVNAKSSAVTAPSITTTVSGDVLVGLFGTSVPATLTPPSGMVERFDVASTTSKYRVASEGADEPWLLPGPTGTRTAEATAAGQNIGQLVALRPAGS
jgi:hypothetical protein